MLIANRADAVLAVLRRDVLLLFSYRLFFVSQVLQGVFTVIMFYFVSRLVGEVKSFGGSSDEYFAAVVVGVFILQVLTATLVQLPTRLRQELIAGTFERVVLSPFGATGTITSMTLFPFVLAFALGIFTMAFAIIVFGLDLRWGTAALALPVAALSAFAFTPFALLIAAVVMSAKQAGAGVGFILPLISLTGGFLFPVALLPGWFRWVSEVQPFTPALELMRHLLVGTPLTDPAGFAVLKLVGFSAVLFPLAVLLLSLAVRRGRRKGTIIEY